jgi:hypothetical protein
MYLRKENHMEARMKLRVIGCVALLLAVSLVSFGQTAATPKLTRAEYQAQLLNVEQFNQRQVQALQTQVEAAQPQDREALQRQIQNMKREGEIQRLGILLKWAKDEGDAARVAEVEKALDLWVNPPQPRDLPAVTRTIPTENTQINRAPASK